MGKLKIIVLREKIKTIYNFDGNLEKSAGELTNFTNSRIVENNNEIKNQFKFR